MPSKKVKTKSTSTAKWGVKKLDRQRQRESKQTREKGKVKCNKLGGERRVSKLEKVVRKKQQDATEYNLRMLKRMSAKKLHNTASLEKCFSLHKDKASGSSDKKRPAEQSVFTDADFEKFAREYTV